MTEAVQGHRPESVDYWVQRIVAATTPHEGDAEDVISLAYSLDYKAQRLTLLERLATRAYLIMEACPECCNYEVVDELQEVLAQAKERE